MDYNSLVIIFENTPSSRILSSMMLFDRIPYTVESLSISLELSKKQIQQSIDILLKQKIIVGKINEICTSFTFDPNLNERTKLLYQFFSIGSGRV